MAAVAAATCREDGPVDHYVSRADSLLALQRGTRYDDFLPYCCTPNRRWVGGRVSSTRG